MPLDAHLLSTSHSWFCRHRWAGEQEDTVWEEITGPEVFQVMQLDARFCRRYAVTWVHLVANLHHTDGQ